MAAGNCDESIFLEQLELWPQQLKGEALWRSARALGIIHYQHSIDRVRRQANMWADSELPRDWQCAASYLTGIYESAHLLPDQQTDDARKAVLWLLNQWVERTLIYLNNRVGCAAARTYRLLGRKDPETALSGLDGLLYFEEVTIQKVEGLPLDVFAEALSHYVTLIWSGHIRLVLLHLAKHAERITSSNENLAWVTDTSDLMTVQELRAQAFHTIFMLVSAASYSATEQNNTTNYSITPALPERPYVPDEQGRDVLLAGTLADEEQIWRQQLSTILSSMMVIGQADSVFLILRKWVEAFLTTPAPEPAARAKLISFIVGIATQTYQLCQQHRQVGLQPLSIANQFRSELLQWQIDGRKQHHPIRSFAQETGSKLRF